MMLKTLSRAACRTNTQPALEMTSQVGLPLPRATTLVNIYLLAGLFLFFVFVVLVCYYYYYYHYHYHYYYYYYYYY